MLLPARGGDENVVGALLPPNRVARRPGPMPFSATSQSRVSSLPPGAAAAQAEIHVLHMDVTPYSHWEIETTAAGAGLKLKAKDSISSFKQEYNGCERRLGTALPATAMSTACSCLSPAH